MDYTKVTRTSIGFSQRELEQALLTAAAQPATICVNKKISVINNISRGTGVVLVIEDIPKEL